MQEGKLSTTTLKEHGLFTNPKQLEVQRIKSESCPVRGYSLFEEPDAAQSVWPCIWIDSTGKKVDERIGGLPALIGQKKRMKLIAALTSNNGPLCAVNSDWSFLLFDDPAKFSYARLVVSFGPPVSVNVPILFEMPRHLQALSAIFIHGKLMFSSATPGTVNSGDFIFLDIPPTEELQVVLTSEIYRSENPVKHRPKARLKAKLKP